MGRTSPSTAERVSVVVPTRDRPTHAARRARMTSLAVERGTDGAAVRRRADRRWPRLLAAALLVPLLVLGGLIGLAIAEPQEGPGHQVIELLETEVRKNEGLHFNIHRGLGRVFSLCPCTARVAASQYQKAYYHRPK